MDERSGPAMPASPYPQPPVTPIPETPVPTTPAAPPIPVGTEEPRRRTTAIVLAAVLIALLLCCGCAVTSVLVARSAFEGVEEIYASGAESVHWTGDGRFAVIQTSSAEEVPMVVAIELETGDTRVEEGFHLVAVEPAGAVVWLVPEGDPAARVLDGWIEESGDRVPDELLGWRLGDPASRPTDRVDARWEPLPGPGEWVAYPEIDPLRGVYPARLLLNNAASSGDGHKAELPDDFKTFDVAGWSASGAYLALVERRGVADEPLSAAGGDGGGAWTSAGAGTAVDIAPLASAMRVLVVEGATGEVVAEAVTTSLSGWSPAGGVAWHPSADRLFMTTVDVSSLDEWGDGATVLMVLEPGGVAREAFDVMGADVPPSVGSAWDLAILGGGPDGVAIVAEGELWMLSDAGVRQVGGAPSAFSSDWHAEGGILALDEEWSDRDGTTKTIVSRYDHRGGGRTTIWEGPERSFDIERLWF